MRDYETLIPEMRNWNNGSGIAVEDWFACSASFDLMIAASYLYWPEFVVYEGCVFKLPFTQNDRDNYHRLSRIENVSKSYIEERINNETIVDLFPNVSPTLDQVLFIGRTLSDAWKTKLSRDFPDRSFVVSFQELEGDKLEDYEITFFQTDPPKIKKANKSVDATARSPVVKSTSTAPTHHL